LELLKPGKMYTDGNYAYYERFSPEVLTVTKRNTQKIERKHLSLRTWCALLVRRGIRFSKTECMHKIVVALTINVRFFGRLCLTQ
jgi:insertion element IS1 protein InsB